MSKTFAAELVRRLAPDLRNELVVQSILPLEIKLHLERLKLTELIRAAERDSRAFQRPQVSAAVRPARFLTATYSEKLERANGFEPSTLTLAT